MIMYIYALLMSRAMYRSLSAYNRRNTRMKDEETHGLSSQHTSTGIIDGTVENAKTTGSWQHVDTDLCGIFPSGDYLVAIDEYSRFPEVEITKSTSAYSTIPKLDRICTAFCAVTELRLTARKGVPPATALHKRNIRTTLSEKKEASKSNSTMRDANAKFRIMQCADKRVKAKSSGPL